MNKLEHIVYLYILIIVISVLSIGAMYYFTDLNTLTESYSNILSKDLYTGIQLISITVIGILFIAVIVKYFFEKDTKEQDYIHKIIDMYL